MTQKIKAGIVGGAGYTGGELLRLLLLHPAVEISFVLSRSHSGKPVADIHSDLAGETTLEFSGDVKQADVIFLCLGHGESKQWLNDNPLAAGTKVIDLSQDFRLQQNGNGFVYGLPEMQREKISNANAIANPGCFATAIQLALLPLASQQLLQDDVHVTAATGSTGAGQSLSKTSHFTWRYGNHSAYKTLEHQHLAEIGQNVNALQPFDHDICFVPSRGAFTRGIHAVLYTKTSLTTEEAVKRYADYYHTHPFVHVTANAPDVKQVVNTNKCLLHVEVLKGRIVITSVIDNLLKGASGQALQNMNLMFGLEETTGLRLKPSAY